MSETALMRQIRAAVNALPGVRLWRNNSGVGRGLSNPGVVTYGLGEGSADLVGVCSVTIVNGPPELYPRYFAAANEGFYLEIGRFFALEVKTKAGRVSAEQAAWARCVRELGGFCATVRSVDDAVAAVERCRRGEQA